MRRGLTVIPLIALALLRPGAAGGGGTHDVANDSAASPAIVGGARHDAVAEPPVRTVQRSQSRPSRRYFTSRLVEPRVVGEDDGVLLERPIHLRATGDGGFVLFDYGDMTVRRFEPDGHLRWTVGGRGQGPGRFAQGSDLRVTSRGEVVVLDNNNGRLTTIAADGRIAAMARVEEPVRGLLGIAGGSVTAVRPLPPIPSGGCRLLARSNAVNRCRPRSRSDRIWWQNRTRPKTRGDRCWCSAGPIDLLRWRAMGRSQVHCRELTRYPFLT